MASPSSYDYSPSFTLRWQPAPETEGDMMIEIFKYTERVVNMIRPRKLLFMAIGESTFPVHDLNSLIFS